MSDEAPPDRADIRVKKSDFYSHFGLTAPIARDPAYLPSLRSQRSIGQAQRPVDARHRVALRLAALGALLAGAAAVFFAARRLVPLVLVAATGCMLKPSAERVEAVEREVASLTSIALTVERAPNKTGGEFLLDRTPEQRERIARAGEEIRAHVRELAGQ